MYLIQMNKKIIRISEKAHLRSDFRKKYFLGWGSNPRKYYIFRAEIFRLFFGSSENSKSPFEIN